MMDHLVKSISPYVGNEPYLHLCFSEESVKKVLVFLRRLRDRGVRVWYFVGNTADRKKREEIERHMLGAHITVVYLDDAFRNDPVAKSRLLTCQRNGQHIICLNTDGGDSGLSIGLHANAYEVKLSRNASADDVESALLRANGFSQELIGEPVDDGNHRLRIIIRIVIAVIVVLLLVGVLWFLHHRPDKQQETIVQTDTVLFSNAALREAVRDALEGGSLTAERLSQITTLRLSMDPLPDDLSDLALLPALETIEISQTAAQDASRHLELFNYTIELFGGASE